MKRWIFLGLIVVAASASVFYLTRNAGGEDIHEVPFRLVEVGRGDFVLTVAASGVIEPIQRVEIRSKASGQVMELPLEEGDLVSKGSLIARLDATDARADLERAKSDVEIREIEERQSEHELERQKELFQQNLISESEVDAAELAASRARASLLVARTELARAKERFEDTEIRSPVDGTVLQKAVEVGQIISSATSSASGGTVIASIADMTRVQVTAGVNEIDIGRVRPGMEARIVADAYPEREFTGRVVRIAPEAIVVQNVTQFDVLINVDNPEGILKSGMNCSATIELMRKNDILLLPIEALQAKGRGEDKNGISVSVRTGNGFQLRDIQVGLSNWEVVEVMGGLQEGDEVKVELSSRAFADQQELQERIRRSRQF